MLFLKWSAWEDYMGVKKKIKNTGSETCKTGLHKGQFDCLVFADSFLTPAKIQVEILKEIM